VGIRILVAIHDLPVWSIPDDQVRRLAAALPDDEVVHVRSEADRPALATADIAFAHRLSEDELERAVRLGWVHSPSVGVGALLTPAALESPVVVTNSRGVHSEAIAEHALALALALRRGLHTAAWRQVEGRWAQGEIGARRVPVLSRTHLLVVGLGSIGSRLAQLGAGLGMRVTGVRRRVDRPAPPYVERVVAASDLGSVLSEADIIVLCAPATRGTDGLIGSSELQAMKSSAVLVNVARGELVDEEALMRALNERRLDGAGLDAFRREPLPESHPFWRSRHALLTPHIAAFSGDYWTPVVDLFLDNVSRFRRGDTLINRVDKDAGY
jgi:phosphoglycerate dehydrogenase-like enzyme